MRKQVGWRIESGLIDAVRGHASSLNETIEQYVTVALTERLKIDNESAVYNNDTDPAIESELETTVRRMREIADAYINETIERKAMLSRNECRAAVVKELGSQYGVCGYFMSRMKALGYKSKKVRFAEYDNPINIWVRDSSLF